MTEEFETNPEEEMPETDEERTISSAEDIVEDFFARLEDVEVVENEGVITLSSNADANMQIASEEPLSIAVALATAGVSMKGEYQFFVEGNPVLADYIVSPGQTVHIHAEQEGGWQ